MLQGSGLPRGEANILGGMLAFFLLSAYFFVRYAFFVYFSVENINHYGREIDERSFDSFTRSRRSQ
jgi:CHASE3 domain sensor protein